VTRILHSPAEIHTRQQHFTLAKIFGKNCSLLIYHQYFGLEIVQATIRNKHEFALKSIRDVLLEKKLSFIYFNLIFVSKFWRVSGYFTLAKLANDLEFTLARRNSHSPWRVWRVAVSYPADA